MSAIASIDFTDFRTAYQKEAQEYLDINAYPESVRMTVIRMRVFRESKVFIDESAKLGGGASGTVYKGSYENFWGEKVICAFKVFEDFGLCVDEVNMLWKSAGVTSIVGLHGLHSYKAKAPFVNTIAIDLVEGSTIGSIETFSKLKSEIQEDAIELARKLFEFLVEIKTPTLTRKKGLIHLDLSCNNVFWNKRKLVVIDTTLMVEIGLQHNPVVQPEIIRAPEILLNQRSEENDTKEEVRYTESVDVWSVGILVNQYVTGKLFLFDSDDKTAYGQVVISQLVGRIGMPAASYLETVVSADKFFDKKEDKTFVLKPSLVMGSKRTTLEDIHKNCPNSSPVMLDLLKRIFVWNPAERLTAEQALTHPIFKK